MKQTSFASANDFFKSGQWTLTKSRIAGGAFFTAEKLMWHRPVGSNAVVCSSRANAVSVSDLFALYTTVVTHNAF